MAATGNLPPMARPWAAASAKWSAQDIVRNQGFFNLPEMLVRSMLASPHPAPTLPRLC